eukprot:COSAG02_NODE_40523_length_404_cov_1.101639_1_plen_69_part_01
MWFAVCACTDEEPVGVLVTCCRTGTRVIDPPDFWNRSFTVYSLVASTEGADPKALHSERRFSEIHSFRE